MHLDFRDDGRLKIFQEPKQGETYAIGMDLSLGLESGDASTAFVINKKLEQVASWFGKEDPDRMGIIAVRLGEYYNKALLAPEINAMGVSTLLKIKELGYLNIYTRMVDDELSSNKRTAKLGWQTNVKTKMEMLNGLVAAYRDNAVTIKDVDLLREMMTLSIEADGNVELNGKDRVVAACIAIQAIQQANSNKFAAITPTAEDNKPKHNSLIDRMLYLEKQRKKGSGYF